ncbi:unnamed protein product [Rangifer tarandus platyrhynchus]|uniref:Uncharacterized protein n=2 Tax=Rangifer tarandus platyrhynchus TaxID=3082113 RepID=A0ABN8XZY1_RANTA|nr:unnamed protein product [Rangifer tarandus platyrhynchus]CAI9692566.1 unnamed protein product [Rangifer tarandus platyrhynchus]
MWRDTDSPEMRLGGLQKGAASLPDPRALKCLADRSNSVRLRRGPGARERLQATAIELQVPVCIAAAALDRKVGALGPTPEDKAALKARVSSFGRASQQVGHVGAIRRHPTPPRCPRLR